MHDYSPHSYYHVLIFSAFNINITMTLHDHPPGFVLCWPNNLFLYYKGKGH